MADQQHPAEPGDGASPPAGDHPRSGEGAPVSADPGRTDAMVCAQSGSGASGEPPRRQFLATASSLAMLAGLGTAYGTLGIMMGRFVYPASGSNRGWLFVCTVDQLAPGEALDFTAPSGAKIVVARQGEGQEAGDFLALSSVCPHLGCRVHWESANDRFFCPCHNGAFDRQGTAIAGPPQAAHQSLLRYPLQVEGGLLYVEAPLTSVVSAAAEQERGTAGKTADSEVAATHGSEAHDAGVA